MATLIGRIVEPPYIDAYNEGVTHNGVDDDTDAFLAALAMCTNTGALSGTATRELRMRGGGSIIVNEQIHAPIGASLVGVNPDLTIIKAGTDFTFSSGSDSVIRGHDALYGAAGPSRRLFLENLLIDGNNRPGANGILASPQQPAKWDSVRIKNCPGYGIYLSDMQQLVADNIEITACGIGLHIDGAQFLYAHGWNIEQSVTSHIKATQDVGVSTGRSVFTGLHLESCTGATWLDFSAVPLLGTIFDGVQVSSLGAGETIWKFNSGSESYYTIRHAEFANDCVAIDNAWIPQTLAATAVFDKHINFYSPNEMYFGGGIRVGQKDVTHTKTLHKQFGWTPASMAVGASEETDFTLTGAAISDEVTVAPNWPSSMPGKFQLTARVSAVDTVRVTMTNVGSGAATPGGYGTAYDVILRKHDGSTA